MIKTWTLEALKMRKIIKKHPASEIRRFYRRQKHETKMINSDNLSKVKWTRDDFIRDDNDHAMFFVKFLMENTNNNILGDAIYCK